MGAVDLRSRRVGEKLSSPAHPHAAFPMADKETKKQLQMSVVTGSVQMLEAQLGNLARRFEATTAAQNEVLQNLREEIRKVAKVQSDELHEGNEELRHIAEAVTHMQKTLGRH